MSLQVSPGTRPGKKPREEHTGARGPYRQPRGRSPWLPVSVGTEMGTSGTRTTCEKWPRGPSDGLRAPRRWRRPDGVAQGSFPPPSSRPDAEQRALRHEGPGRAGLAPDLGVSEGHTPPAGTPGGPRSQAPARGLLRRDTRQRCLRRQPSASFRQQNLSKKTVFSEATESLLGASGFLPGKCNW